MRLDQLIKKISNLILIIPLVLIVVSSIMLISREPKKYSNIENRNLKSLPSFSFEDFFQGEYQSDLESAIADQFPLSQTIKKNMLSSENSISYYFSNVVNKIIGCENRYVKFLKNSYVFSCDDYLIRSPLDIEKRKNDLSKTLLPLSKINASTTFLYINSSDSIDFSEEKINDKFYDYIVENYFFENIDELEIKDWDTYKKYYYKTDHHLNHVGIQKAYEKIIRIYDIPSAIQPFKEIEFEVNFDGSRARTESFYLFKENFRVYKYNFFNFDTYINGVLKPYGNYDKYYNFKYDSTVGVNHYGSFYGGDVGELIYDTKRNELKNILIISSSFSNALNPLVANHFNKTFVIDPRHYSRDMNEEFDINNYIIKNEIDEVLIFFDITAILDEKFILEVK